MARKGRARPIRRDAESAGLWKALVKVAKAAEAKSVQAKLNFLIDAAHELGSVNSQQDKLMHFANELTTGKGTATDRLARWSKKARKYRR